MTNAMTVAFRRRATHLQLWADTLHIAGGSGLRGIRLLSKVTYRGVPQRSHVIGSPLCCVVRSQEAAAYLTSTGWVDRSARAAAARFGFPMILQRESVVVLSGCSPSSPRS